MAEIGDGDNRLCSGGGRRPPQLDRIAFAVVKPAKVRGFQDALFDTDFDGNADVAKSGEHDAKTGSALFFYPRNAATKSRL